MNPLNALMWVFLAGGAASGPAGGAVDPSGFHLQAGRFGMPAASIRGFVFVAGGCSDDGLCDDIEGMDSRTGVVLFMSPSVLPRYFHSGAAYNDRFILVGGVTEDGGVTGEVEEFTPDGEGSIEKLPPLPVPVSTTPPHALSTVSVCARSKWADGLHTGIYQRSLLVVLLLTSIA